ncbi:MAG: hypothetical protein NVS4B8_22020 [Herpetosiphon sp.]
MTAGTYPGHHAVALGLLAAGAGVNPEMAVHAELHGWATSWIAAAVRLGALTYIEAQSLLRHVTPIMVAAAADTLHHHWSEMSSWGPLIDIRQMQHAGAQGRLFAS